MKDIENMSVSKLSNYVVLYDLSNIYNDEDLLKLIEESSLQLILLASRDNLSDVLISRCKTILKIPDIDVKPCKYISEISALSTISTLDNSSKYLMENCPQLEYDLSRVQFLKYKDRLANIIANIREGEKQNE